MSALPVIAKYEALSSLFGQMRDAAIKGEWETFTLIEKESSELMESIKVLDATVSLNTLEQQQKTQLIQKMHADDVEIVKFTQSHLTSLQASIQSNRQEQRLQQAYGI